MPQRIDRLTAEQEAAMPKHADMWIEIGLSTKPAEFEEAIEGAVECYKVINTQRPYFLRMSSPFGAVVGGIVGTLCVQAVQELGEPMFAAMRTTLPEDMAFIGPKSLALSEKALGQKKAHAAIRERLRNPPLLDHVRALCVKSGESPESADASVAAISKAIDAVAGAIVKKSISSGGKQTAETKKGTASRKTDSASKLVFHPDFVESLRPYIEEALTAYAQDFVKAALVFVDRNENPVKASAEYMVLDWWAALPESGKECWDKIYALLSQVAASMLWAAKDGTNELRVLPQWKLDDPEFMLDAMLIQSAIPAQVNEIWTAILPTLAKPAHEIYCDLAENLKACWTHYRGGNLWAGWYAWISYLRDVCDWENESLAYFAHDEKVAKHAGWWWLGSLVCAISDRPHCLHFDDQRRGHSEKGPAFGWRDGFGMWMLEGIAVDRQIVDHPETQTIEQIDAETNEDRRVHRIRRFGEERYLKESGAEILDERFNERDQQQETLYKVKKTGAHRFKCVDPSTGRNYFLGVDTSCHTCEDAQRWMNHELEMLAVHRS